MKKTFLLLFFSMFIFFFSCKTDTQQDNTGTKEAISKEWPYFAQEEKIKGYLTVDKIPEDFPKHFQDETYQEYFNRCAEWSKNNLDKIKPELRDKVTNYKMRKK